MAAEAFYLWQWPGADREKINYFVDDYLDESAFRSRYAFMDDQGREWVYTIIWDGNFGGMIRDGSAEGWVCMSDLYNDQMPSFYPAPAPVTWSPDSPAIWPPSIIIIAAAGVAVLILVIRRSKTKESI
jgi:hypothetical protein